MQKQSTRRGMSRTCKLVVSLALLMLAALGAGYGLLLEQASRSSLSAWSAVPKSMPPVANIQPFSSPVMLRDTELALSAARRLGEGSVDSPSAVIQATVLSEDAIAEALQQVRIDENGDVILDHEAMLALNQVLGERNLVLDALGIARLQELIQLAMPGQAGTQVALVAGNYYQYLTALREYDQLHAEVNPDFEVREANVQRLREIYLGEEVTARLFGQADAEKRFMYENFQLSADESLTTAEKRLLKRQSRQRYLDSLLSMYGWQERYQQFQQERDRMLAEVNTPANAVVSMDHAVVQQVHKLFANYFNGADQESMQRLQIPVLPESAVEEMTHAMDQP